MTESRPQCPCAQPPIAPFDRIPDPRSLVASDKAPDTISAWQTLADSLLTHQACAFHRNVEISSRYAWVYKSLPTCLKWAAMAAIASHHVRLALFPLRLDRDRTGYVDIPHSLGRRRLLLKDVHTIRETNNAIFHDIFWVHLAYVSTDDGIHRLRTLLRGKPEYAAVLAGFDAIDQGRRVLEQGATSEERRAADDLIWQGNVQLLEHEQRALVQPRFDMVSCAFARLASLGAATSFDVRGARQELACFTSFYSYSLTHGAPDILRSRRWPRITRYDDRWRWIDLSVVPQFRRFDADGRLVDASMRRIFDDARAYAALPCELPAEPR